MLPYEPPPCARSFEIWHNLHYQGDYQLGERAPMRLAFTGTLLLPSTDPTAASFLFRLLRDPGHWEFDFWPDARALARDYQAADLRPAEWGDLIVVGSATWAATPLWKHHDHPTLTGQAVTTTNEGATL